MLFTKKKIQEKYLIGVHDSTLMNASDVLEVWMNSLDSRTLAFFSSVPDTTQKTTSMIANGAMILLNELSEEELFIDDSTQSKIIDTIIGAAKYYLNKRKGHIRKEIKWSIYNRLSDSPVHIDTAYSE